MMVHAKLRTWLVILYLRICINEFAHTGHFDLQVSSLASEAKREKNALTKEVTKISNYGISV